VRRGLLHLNGERGPRCTPGRRLPRTRPAAYSQREIFGRRHVIKRIGAFLTMLALVAAGCLLAMSPAGAAGTSANTLRVGHGLAVGSQLRSPNGKFRFIPQGDGNLVLYSGNRALWASGTKGAAASLQLNPDHNLVLYTNHRPAWTASTVGSGATVLSLTNTGFLGLYAAQGLVWSPGYGNGCGANRSGPHIYVSITQQLGRICSAGNQLLITALTTGAAAYGDGTPTGTWRVDNKVRNTRLFPSDGGSYAVQYWLPYVGNEYGFHDSSWQTMPYGSQQYTTGGSHGCVHLPLAVMAWVFNWAPIGTLVTVSR
jgi:L,D-transpeptidase catalytic domain